MGTEVMSRDVVFTEAREPVPGAPAGLRGALDRLSAELSALGWASRVRALPGRPAGLRVVNPEPGAAALSEDVYARPGEGGGWAFWWPWGEVIAADAAGAAAVIVRVLRPAVSEVSQGCAPPRG